MKVLSVVGARPQFIKAVMISQKLRRRNEEIMVHTGQHYDFEMSEQFFNELKIPKPDYNLEVGSGSHAVQTGKMMELIEELILEHGPDCTLVYGDTNSTLAGALASAKVHVPVIHVEAGLRSFDKTMPEEVNRVMTDHLSELLFCPHKMAAGNLAAEGITKGVHVVGDVMVETLWSFAEASSKLSHTLRYLELKAREYLVVTIHRADNTGEPERLEAIVEALCSIHEEMIFPLHPRTLRSLVDFGLINRLNGCGRIKILDPFGYLDFLQLQANARMILTDSGGIQKESYMLGVPCVTLRDTTEWTETVDAGWNVLVGADKKAIKEAVENFKPSGERKPLYGDGKSAEKIVAAMTEHFS